jgi:transcriptional antiterminator NusG
MADPLKPRWYAIHVVSGFEEKTAREIWLRVEKAKLQDLFEEIVVPQESVVEVKRGVKKNVARSILPGYVLVRMRLTDDSWHLVRQIPNVAKFLGPSGKPTPLSDKEVVKIMNQAEEAQEKARKTIHFDTGEQVRVEDGPFASFMGQVEVVDQEKQRLKVSVSIFGRSTPVDLDFSQVAKV